MSMLSRLLFFIYINYINDITENTESVINYYFYVCLFVCFWGDSLKTLKVKQTNKINKQKCATKSSVKNIFLSCEQTYIVHK